MLLFITRLRKVFFTKLTTGINITAPLKIFSILNKIKIWFAAVVLCLLFCYLFYFFSLLFQVSLIRAYAVWLTLAALVYWVSAAVWCLYDKDDFGRNVSASDDFYNVAFSALWLVEGFLLSLFLSYTKLFDFYDSFLDPEQLESAFYNEDADGSELKNLLFSFLTVQFVMFVLDSLCFWESANPFWVVVFLVATTIWLLVYFLKVSVQFIEEFDFEEQSDYVFDDEDGIFEFEDFPEEGIDGGDYAEGYEILQLFFSYWHYMFICLHVMYLTYSTFVSKGKQTHLYWGVIAICQNMILILLLDFLDWGELVLFFENPQQNTMYSWFYISEDPSLTFFIYWTTLTQYLEFFTPWNLDPRAVWTCVKTTLQQEQFLDPRLQATLKHYLHLVEKNNL